MIISRFVSHTRRERTGRSTVDRQSNPKAAGDLDISWVEAERRVGEQVKTGYQAVRQADRGVDRQVDRQTDRQPTRKVDRQAGSQAGR